jgi:hypothetical protein
MHKLWALMIVSARRVDSAKVVAVTLGVKKAAAIGLAPFGAGMAALGQ